MRLKLRRTVNCGAAVPRGSCHLCGYSRPVEIVSQNGGEHRVRIRVEKRAALLRDPDCSNVATLRVGGIAMPITTLSSREFNQDTSGAKKAAKEGPVFITDRGRPAHVLLTIDEYQRLSGGVASIVEMLAMPGTEDIEFEAPRAQGLYRPADPG